MRDLKSILERDGFIYGMIVAWFRKDSYGCDIGCHHRNDILYKGSVPWYTGVPHNSNECRFDPATVEEIFRNCKAIGYNCVRIWLFEIMEGIEFDEDGYATGLQQVFVDNLHTVLDIAGRVGLHLIVTLQLHISYSMQWPEEYKFFTQIIHKPEYTRTYVENCVIPVAKILSNHENVVMAEIYGEPEGDVAGPDGNLQLYGGTWDEIRHYIREVAKALKEYAPRLPVTVASGWLWRDSIRKKRYNDLGLDYIGVDIYNDEGAVEPAGSLETDGIPVWIAEFGPTTNDEARFRLEEPYTEVMLKFYENARANGYIGAFNWFWGYPQSKEALTMIDPAGRLRDAADAVHAMIEENTRKRIGGRPQPQLLYIKDARDIAWFPSKGAEGYRLERSFDLRSWEVAGEVRPECPDGVKRLGFSDTYDMTGRAPYYRVIAVFPDGEETYSPIAGVGRL